MSKSSAEKTPNIGFEMDMEGKASLHQVSRFLRRGMVDVTKATVKANAPIWLEHTQHRTDAVIGHVLHSTPDGVPIQTLEANVQNSKSTERAFATNAPGVLPLLKSLQPLFSESRQAIQVRMTPSPWTSFGLDGAAAFPQIEMQIVFDETQMPFMRTLKAVVDERVSDIMLPQDMADVRFISRTSLGYAATQADSNLATFLANGNLKVTGTGRLGVPPTLKMRIPSRVLRKDSQVAKEISGENGCDDVEMEYIFAGLDFRDYLQYNLGDYIMTYTKIEGGITGGRRGELMLHKAKLKVPSNNMNHDSSGFDQDFGQLFDMAYKVVRALDNRGSKWIAASILNSSLPHKPASTDGGAEIGG